MVSPVEKLRYSGINCNGTGLKVMLLVVVEVKTPAPLKARNLQVEFIVSI
jgi:hypothetical protein